MSENQGSEFAYRFFEHFVRFLQAKEDLLTKKSESLFKMNNVDRKSEERMSEFRTMVKTAKTATVFSVKQLRSRLDSGKLLLDTYTVASLNTF